MKLGLNNTLYHIARRHGHVFRMALHNEGDWRMETWQRARRASCHVSIRQSPSCVMPFWTHAKWQRARRASCHVSIRQSPSCVMPFWTHAKCLLDFISYLPMWIKAKYTFIKTVYSPRFYGGPYLQAKHADVFSGVLFWTACTRRPHVLSLPSSSGCKKSDSWRQARSVKTAKKVMNGTTMWSCGTELCTNGVEATKSWVFVAHFSIHSTSRCRCHTGTDIPRLRGHWHSSNQPGGTYCQAQDFLLRTNYTLEMWCANTKSANQVPTSPVKTLVIPMSWSYRYFEWQER